MLFDERVLHHDHLDEATSSEVLELANAAGDADGAQPLSEHVVSHIRNGGDAAAVHLLIRADREQPNGHPRTSGTPVPASGALIAYAYVDTTDAADGASAELVVHPMFRRKGLGRSLVQATIAVANERCLCGPRPGRLRLWAHGDHPSARALAMSLGFERQRVLIQMRRSLDVPIPAPHLPEDTRLRAFRPGLDDSAWLALNAEAFVQLPDQGQWVLADLHTRLAEPWFDPEGFLLAERISDGRLLGFHWTKVHRSIHAHDPIGEVYVLGVAPAAAGTGLGRALTLAGLHHLRGLHLDQVMLYVDQANPRAITLYEKMGFAPWSTHICFTRRV